MTIPTIPVYTGGVANPDGSQDQQEFTTNMFNQLSYEAALAPSLNNTVNEMNAVSGQVDTNAAIAQNSADAAQAAANFEGEFVVGVTSAEKGKSYLYNGEVWLCLQNTTTTPFQGASEWKLSVGEQYVTTAQGDVLGGKLFNGSNGETVENGDFVEPGTTHLRVLVGGEPTIVAMSHVASGTVSSLTETGAIIGVTHVDLMKIKADFDNFYSFKSSLITKVGQKVSTGATVWKVLPSSSSKGVLLDNGLKAIALNGIYAVDFNFSEGSSASDNVQSWKDIVDTALSMASSKIKLPRGIIEVNESGVLSYSGGLTNLQGLHVEGEGYNHTVIKMISSGSPMYFYDNDSISTYQFASFEGIRFEGDDLEFVSGFKQWSSGHEQSFNFTKCWFENLYDALDFEGTANASENRFFMCKFRRIRNSLLTLNNQQSLNTEFYGCDGELLYKDLVYVDTNAGGSVKWIGGSVILSDGGYAEEGFIVNEKSGVSLGTNNKDYLFSFRTELRTVDKKLVDTQVATNSPITVKFTDSNLSVTDMTTPTRTAVSIRAQDTVKFDNCVMSKVFEYVINGLNEGTQNNGQILFSSCEDGSDLPERCTVNNFGLIRGRDMNWTDLAGAGPYYASDFDVSPFQSGRGTNYSLEKSSNIFPPSTGFPRNNSLEKTFVLPVNAIIKDITVIRYASGSSASTYQLFVGNDDKTETYGQSVSDDQSNEHRIEVSNLLKKTGTGLNERTIRLWSTGGDTVLTDGFAVVTYY